MTTERVAEKGACILCSKQYSHWGNNALPIKDGRCCDDCNTKIVIPARISAYEKVMQMINNRQQGETDEDY